MKKYFTLLLLFLFFPICVNAAEKSLICYVKDVDKSVNEVYYKVLYNDQVDKVDSDLAEIDGEMGDIYKSKNDKSYHLDSKVVSNNIGDVNMSDYYVFLIVISIVAIVISSSKRFITTGR